MSFQTLTFFIFFVIIFALYWGVRPALRPWVLLVAGYVFYAFAGWQYLLLLIYVTGVSRIGTLMIAREPDLKAIPDHAPQEMQEKKVIPAGSSAILLTIFLAFLLAPLVIYKVLGFFDTGILIPVGLSFYTFEAVGFLVDVYQGKTEPAKDLKGHALFLSFFPQLLSGPIARAGRLMPQLEPPPVFDAALAAHGARLFLWGLYKKAALADTIAANAEPIFASPASYSGFTLLAAAVLFSLEIYCDFSGYSDMAIGIAALLGIRLDDNFRRPYFAGSFRDFWGRWHISLSTWLRDYIYIPLGGNRKGKLRRDLNLLITFFVSGLWHGSGITFVVWGVLHGFFLLIERHLPAFTKADAKDSAAPGSSQCMPAYLLCAVRHIFIFLAVTAAWVIFHTSTLADAGYILLRWTDGITAPMTWIREGLAAFNDKKVLIVMFIVLFIGDLLQEKSLTEPLLRRLPGWLRIAVTVGFVLFIWGMLPFHANHQFLYFAF